MSSYGILWGFVGYIRLMTRCGNGRIRGKPHGADAPPQPNGQKTMDRTITLTSDEIVNITSAIEDRIILLEDYLSKNEGTPIAHKRLKEFKEIKAKLNY